jgi:HK97 family phage prohead protease
MTTKLQFELKELGEPGTFSGLAAVYGNVDLGGDVIEPGAFTKTLAERGPEKPLLWSHDLSNPVGLARINDGPQGLQIQGTLDLDTQAGRDAYTRLRKGIVKGLSIGFRSLKDTMIGGLRHILAADVFEISLTCLPMNTRALVSSVKSASDLSTIRDFEHFLREAGFSRSKSTAIAVKGWAAGMETPDADPDDELRQWLEGQLAR